MTNPRKNVKQKANMETRLARTMLLLGIRSILQSKAPLTNLHPNPTATPYAARQSFWRFCSATTTGNTRATAVSLTQRQSAISDVSNSPVNFIYVLSLVSCYVRIIGIFDSLLRQLNELQCRKGFTPPDYGVVSAGLTNTARPPLGRLSRGAGQSADENSHPSD